MQVDVKKKRTFLAVVPLLDVTILYSISVNCLVSPQLLLLSQQILLKFVVH
jgi:hypothetical protein